MQFFISLTFLKKFDFVLTIFTSYMLERFSSHKFLEFATLYSQFKRLRSGKSVMVVHEKIDFALLVADITGDT